MRPNLAAFASFEAYDLGASDPYVRRLPLNVNLGAGEYSMGGDGISRTLDATLYNPQVAFTGDWPNGNGNGRKHA